MKRLKGNLSVAFINKTFFSDYQDVSVINMGICFLWAYVAYHLYEEVELWDTGAHAFIRSKRTRRFYDSERPKGVKDWKDLPATNFGVGCGCHACKKGASKLTLSEFMSEEHWGQNAHSRGINWKSLHEQMEKVIEEHNT